MRPNLVLFFFMAIACSVAAKQQLSFKNITAKTARYNGTACLCFKFDAVLKYSSNQLKAAHDSTDWYNVHVPFKDSILLNAAKGFGRLADSTGVLTGTKRVFPYGDVKLNAAQEIYIPLASFDLPEGSHYLKPLFFVTNSSGDTIDCNFKIDTIKVLMPQRLKLKISISEIEVSPTDGHGESWDYYLFNPRNAKPEVCWSTVFAGTKLNGSPYTTNSYFYTDTEHNDDFEFSICKGDIFYIKVFDFDITSFSDLIGALKIDMDSYKNEGPLHIAKFNLVLNMDYSITQL